MRVVTLAIATLTLAAGSARAAIAETSSASTTALFSAAYKGRASGDAGLSYRPGQGLVRWKFDDSQTAGGNGLRVATASLDANPAATLLRPGRSTDLSNTAFELTYVRNWPAAVSLSAGKLNLDITPRIGLGLSSAGSQLAEIGAMARLGSRLIEAVGADHAVRGSRLFLFAGASRRASGLNLLHNQGLSRKLGTDGVAEGAVRQAEAGLGFSHGALSASLGYSYERTRLKALGGDVYGFDRLGLNLSIRP